MTQTASGPAANREAFRDWLPFVSVIVPVFNDTERLATCLEALESQTYPSERYEVVVVDNASSEPVLPLLSRFAHAVAEYEATPGSYAARNRGILRARGEVLAFTDADCIPCDRWIEAGVASMDGPARGLVSGRVDVFPRHGSRPNAVELYEMLYAFTPQDKVLAGLAPTANLFVRRCVMDEVGMFDAALKSLGDVVWTSRAVNAGHEVLYCNAASVRHPARRSLPELRRRYARFAGGHFDLGRSAGRLPRERVKALLMLAPPLRLARQVLTGRSALSWSARAGVVAVAYFARLAYAWEWCRLEMGAASRRE